MEQYIKKSALVAEIEKFIERAKAERVLHPKTILAAKNYILIEDYKKLLSFLDTLEVKDAQCTSSEIELKAHAEEYSFNIESELFMQLTPEQQKLWRKEIEQAVISGGHFSLEHRLNTQRSNICFQNIDDLFEEDGIDPASKDIKIFKECYYTALERYKEKKGIV